MSAPEYWFYHLEGSTLQGVLPGLLEKTLQKGWRALVKLPESELADMDQWLWTYRDESFLPHGRADAPQADLQPIVLDADAQTASGYGAVFLTQASRIADLSGVARVMVMIDGRSPVSVQDSRRYWKELKASGQSLSYYQQTPRGAWEKKA